MIIFRFSLYEKTKVNNFSRLKKIQEALKMDDIEIFFFTMEAILNTPKRSKVNDVIQKKPFKGFSG